MKALRTFWNTGVRCRCPQCGATSMFSGFYEMHERCSVCDTRLAPSSGEWLGALAIGYTVGAVVAIALAIAEVLWSPLRSHGIVPTWTIAAISLSATALCYRWAKAMWFALL